MNFKNSPRINNPALYEQIKKQEQQNGEFLNPIIAAICKHYSYISAACSDLDNFTIINRLLLAFDWKGHQFKNMTAGQIYTYREMSLTQGLVFIAVCQDNNIQKIQHLKIYMPTVETPFFKVDFEGFLTWLEWAIYNGITGRFLRALASGYMLTREQAQAYIYAGRLMSLGSFSRFCKKEGLITGE